MMIDDYNGRKISCSIYIWPKCPTQLLHIVSLQVPSFFVKFGLPYTLACRPLPLFFPPSSVGLIHVTLIMRTYQVLWTSATSRWPRPTSWPLTVGCANFIINYMATIDSRLNLQSRLWIKLSVANNCPDVFTYTLEYTAAVDSVDCSMT